MDYILNGMKMDRSGKKETIRMVVQLVLQKDGTKMVPEGIDWMTELMRKFLLVVYIGFLLLGVGRILSDVFREEPFNYLNILISALSFFGILNYINTKLNKED